MLIPNVGISEQAVKTPEKKPAATGIAPAHAAARTEMPDDAQLNAAVLSANRALAPNSIEFSLDRESGKTVVKVVDAATQQLIRQIPSLEMLDIARAIDHLQGTLLKLKA